MRYPALIEDCGEEYEVAFPDVPGCAARGSSIEEAMENAHDALNNRLDEIEAQGKPVPEPSRLEDVEVPRGRAITSVLVVREEPDKPSVRLNLKIDLEVANIIETEARRRGMSRKDYITWMMKTLARMGA